MYWFLNKSVKRWVQYFPRFPVQNTSVSGDINTIRTDSLLTRAAHVGQGVHQTLRCLCLDPTDAWLWHYGQIGSAYEILHQRHWPAIQLNNDTKASFRLRYLCRTRSQSMLNGYLCSSPWGWHLIHQTCSVAWRISAWKYYFDRLVISWSSKTGTMWESVPTWGLSQDRNLRFVRCPLFSVL